MERLIHLDFETFSFCDLKTAGAWAYGEHETTAVLVMAYNMGGHTNIWTPPQVFPYEIIDAIKSGHKICAHNAGFEMAIFNTALRRQCYDIPNLKPTNFICTAARARAYGLPGALEDVADLLGLSVRKDKQGKALLAKFSKPNYTKAKGFYRVMPSDAPEEFEQLKAYCSNDVAVEMAVDKHVPHLSHMEQAVWEVCQEINARGVCVDVEAIHKAQAIIDIETEILDDEVYRLTEGEVPSARAHIALARWLKERWAPTKGLNKSDTLELLDSDAPPVVKELAKIRQATAKSSTAKLNSMLKAKCKDDRIRDMFMYHGASTGRWAGRRVQLQNMPRPMMSDKKVDQAFRVISKLPPEQARDELDMFYGPTLQVMSDCLRGFLIPAPKRSFFACDYSAIEARVLAWLAGQEETLEVFRTHGKLYEHTAAGIYNIHIDKINKSQRQIGKVASLALGYGGGVGAFQSMAKNYGLHVPDETADDIKNKWREANRVTVNYWYSLEDAAIRAMVDRGKEFSAGHKDRRVTFKFVRDVLRCILPSGRGVHYFKPRLQEVMKWGRMRTEIQYLRKNSVTNKVEWTSIYGGLIAENVTQAVSRDILAWALVKLARQKYDIVLHAHDEIVIEISKIQHTSMIKRLMIEPLPWAKDLPLDASGYTAMRYKKD